MYGGGGVVIQRWSLAKSCDFESCVLSHRKLEQMEEEHFEEIDIQ